MTDNSVLQARARFWKVAGAIIAALVVLSTAKTNLKARHATSFVATDLRTLGGNFSEAFAVSDKGVVVGRSANDQSVLHAFMWTEATGMIDLGALPDDSVNSAALINSSATLVNNDGVIAGFDTVPTLNQMLDFHAFVRTHATGLVPIPTLGGSSISPTAINSRGAVVGSSFLQGDQTFHAFLWTQRDGTVDLGTLGGTTSTANAISDDGVVVGQSATAPDDVPHAFMWTRHGNMVDLGTLEGGSNSFAQGVNNDGVIVGFSDTATIGESHAFVWTRRSGMVDIGKTLGSASFGDKINGRFVIFHTSTSISTSTSTRIITRSFVWTEKRGVVDIGTLGGDNSLALDVSESGVVVGGSFTAGNAAFHAFAWSESMGMVPLKSGVGTSQANAINGNLIVGSSCDAQNVCHATLWKPSSHSHHEQGDDDDQD